MEPRFGRLYASAVLRPLAEQVAGVLEAQPGETACDLMCDGGTLGVALGAAVGTQGHVVLIDTDVALLATASREVAATGCGVSTRLAPDGVEGLGDPGPGASSFDRVASLCTLGFWEDESFLTTAARLTRPEGRAAVLTWDAASPPAHERALVDALHDVIGVSSRFLGRCLAQPDPEQAALWDTLTLNDVVRFDGIAMFWAALVAERPIAQELRGHADEALHAVRDACARALQPWTAADATIRIPVRATLWCSPR